MSDQLRTGTAVGTASAAGGARATLHTGRCIDGRDECYNRVPAWAQLKDRASIESYPLNDDLKAVLARARLCDEDQLMCYRGRRIPFWKPSPAASNMGPPPLGSKGTDRYNYDGQVVLYLTRSIDRIAEEVCPIRGRGSGSNRTR